MMGKTISKAFRPLKNFNLENRAQKALESEKIRPAPRHPSTATVFDSIAQEHPEYLAEQKTKHAQLDEFLKKVRVDSVGDNPEIKPKTKHSLPEDRGKITPAEFGFPDPVNIPEGRASLRQMLELISQHHLRPEEITAQKIAEDYKLDATQVQYVLRYFQTLHLHIPEKMLKQNPKLLNSLGSIPAQQPTLTGMDNVLKLGQAIEESTNGPQQKN